MKSAGRVHLLRLFAAAFAATLAGIGCTPDPSAFSCTSSAECPTGYHCDLGTPTTAGKLKCASGAPQQKTLAVDATKFLLSNAPSADGTVRTTIVANAGAVTSSPDFVGVRAVASQAGTDLASSQVLADGSVLEFQLPTALTQVELRVEDDSGHFVAVVGYPEQVELSFVGKDVAGSANPSAAYDVTTTSDSLYAPGTWLSSGPGPVAGKPAEFALQDTLAADGGVLSSTSYASIATADYHTGSTIAPAVLQDPTSSPPGTTPGWQEIAPIPTADNPDGGSPPARVAGTLVAGSLLGGPSGSLLLYGGTDGAGATVDAPGTFWTFDQATAWTQVVPPAGPNATPPTVPTSGVAIGYGGSSNASCTPPCTVSNYEFTMAGGFGSLGLANINQVVAYGTQTAVTAGGSTSTTGWFQLGTLSFANAGMSSAPAAVPISNSSTSGSSENFAGVVMVGGQAIKPGSGAAGSNFNDQGGCMLYAGYPFGTASAAANQNISCTDSNWATTSGEIGYRTGATLIAINSTTFALFGGNKTNGTNPSFPNAYKNDLWIGTLGCNVVAPAITCTTQVKWVKETPTSGSPPPPRVNAGGAFWQTTVVFTPPPATTRPRIAIYGGTDASSNTLNDFWEYDLAAHAWRQIAFDASPALAPAARTGFAMSGDAFRAYLFGGSVSGAVSNELWTTTREGPARLLMKAPFSLPAIGQATGLGLTIDAPGAPLAQAFLWDGTRWRFVATSVSDAGLGYRLFASPLAPATSFLQPDGNIYLLLMSTFRATPSLPGAAVSVDRLKMTVDFR